MLFGMQRAWRRADRRPDADARRSVVFLTWRDTTNPEGGGSELFVERVAEYLAGHGWDVTICTSAHPAAPADEVRQGVQLRRLRDVVLAGHSYGGMVITGVADRIADKVGALAYLDAFIPQDGQSLFDINIAANSQRFLEGAGANGGLRVPPPSAAYFGVNAADAGSGVINP